MIIRKKIPFYFTIITTAAIVFLNGCMALQDLAETQKPALSIADVRATDFSFNEIELTFDIEVKNPNPVALQLLSYGYDFNINGNTFVKGDQEKGLMIEASGQSIVQIPVQLNFQQLYNLFSSLRGEEEADYKLLADLSFDLPVVGKTTLPIEKSGSVPMVKIPEINAANLEVRNLSFSEANLILKLEVDNPNGFGLIAESINYNLEVNGEDWIESSVTNQINITENSEQQISLPISLNPGEIGLSIVQVLQSSGELNFTLNGSFNFGTTHPLLEETIFNFQEDGVLPVIR